MRRLPLTSVLAALVSVMLFAASCAGSDTEPPAGEPAAPPSTDASSTSTGESPAADAPADRFQAAIDAAAEAYERTIGVWDGFDPREHPMVVPMRSGGEISHALAVNHPNAAGLGAAESLDTAGTPFETMHRVTDLDDAVRRRLDGIPHFDFNAMLGDVDSFVMIADPDDPFLDPAGDDWGPTMIHEMFHRYQFDAFADGFSGQDVDGYAYTEDNLVLAALEERALRAAVTATSDDGRVDAASHFVGLRLARLAADDRVRLDDAQERYEGTARYIEHLMSGTDARYTYTDANYDRDLLTGVRAGAAKDDYGFGRFYASGAAVMRLLELLGVEDATDRVERGEVPSAILADHLGVTGADAPPLVEAARSAYGDTDLGRDAAAAAAGAADEPSFFGDDEHDHADEGGVPDGDLDGEEIIELTDEQEQCLSDAEDEIGADGIIPDDVWERCVAA